MQEVNTMQPQQIPGTTFTRHLYSGRSLVALIVGYIASLIFMFDHCSRGSSLLGYISKNKDDFTTLTLLLTRYPDALTSYMYE